MADTTNVTPQAGDNDSAPIQTAPTPSTLPAAAPGADTANSAATLPKAGPVASPATQPPAPVAGQDMSDQSKSPNMATKVLSALMGGKPTGYAQTDKGPVPVTRDWKPGELARHVVASAASLLAAGSGGALAAKQKRPFELAPGSSLGDIKDAQQEKDKADAQAQFENNQNTSKLVLQQHADAREQQASMIEKGKYDQATQAWTVAHANDDLIPKEARQKILQNMQDADVKNQMAYEQFLTMPGSQVMQDADGKELNFATGDEAKAYVTAHPDAFHGMSNGKSKFGVVVVANPYTGATQLIDFPADRHENGLSLVGAKKDDNGEYLKDDNGDFVPDGSILDPKTKKPTYLTETVTPDQVRDIKAKSINQDLIMSKMNNYDAQAKLRDAEVNKYPELKTALNLADSGNFDAMTDAQKKIAGTFMLKQESNMESQLKNAENNLQKLSQAKLMGEASDEDVAGAQKAVDEARDRRDDVVDKYNNTTGNTAGVRYANRAARDAKIFTQPWAQTDAEIKASPMSADEQAKAGTRIWNLLTPAQRAQVNPTPDTQGKAVVANQQNAPAAKPHQTPANPAAPGYVYIYNLEGVPHAVLEANAPKYLADPNYKGWTK
jgi:hypothetical protein